MRKITAAISVALALVLLGTTVACEPTDQEKALIAKRITDDFNTAEGAPHAFIVTTTIRDVETGEVTTQVDTGNRYTGGITTDYPRQESGWQGGAPRPFGVQEVKVCWTARQYLAGWVQWYTFCNATYWKWAYGRVIMQEPGTPNNFYGPQGVGFYGLLNASEEGTSWYRAPYWYTYFTDGYWPYSGLHSLADGKFKVCPMFTVFGIGCTPTFTIRIGIRAHSDGTVYYTIDSNW